jgi:hypothetical protein
LVLRTQKISRDLAKSKQDSLGCRFNALLNVVECHLARLTSRLLITRIRIVVPYRVTIRGFESLLFWIIAKQPHFNYLFFGRVSSVLFFTILSEIFSFRRVLEAVWLEFLKFAKNPVYVLLDLIYR